MTNKETFNKVQYTEMVGGDNVHREKKKGKEKETGVSFGTSLHMTKWTKFQPFQPRQNRVKTGVSRQWEQTRLDYFFFFIQTLTGV